MGIAIGVASVVLIASLGEIGKNSINQEIDSLGVGGVMLSGDLKNVSSELTREHLDAVRESGTVDSAIPVQVEYTKSYMRELMLDVVAWGIDYGAGQVISMKVLHGRLITKNDVRGEKRVCVIDQNVALAYYKRENIVGKSISLQTGSGIENFEVVGVVSSGGNIIQGMMGNFIPPFVYLPYTTLQSLTRRDTFDQIAVRVKAGIDGDVAGAQLVRTLQRVSGGGSYKAENVQGKRNELNGILDIVTLLLSLIAGISLLVAGLSIMTVMLVSVGERTREIGIKKSIGAKRHNILTEFLIESLAISLSGSIIGVFSGLIIISIGCAALDLPFLLNYGLIGFCAFFAVVIGMLFGVYPASVAAGLNPVDALRYE
jgi:putative ABC transport system permease protein